MVAILFLLAVLWISAGAGLILYTDQFRGFYRKALQQSSMRLFSALALLVGLLLFAAAFSKSGPLWLLLLLGLAAITKGAYLALAPADQIRTLQEWWVEKASERTIRLWGIIALLLGASLLSHLL